jgi:hypothetical protein
MAAIYKTWADGDPFTAAEADTYFMRQVAIACNNQTDRDAILSPQDGMVVYRKDTKAIERYNGSSWDAFDTQWQTYTPSLTNITLGNGVLTGCKYFRTGKRCSVKFRLKFGTTTGMGTDPTFSLPLTAAALNATANIPILGWGQYFYTSAGAPFPCAIEHASTTTCTIRAMATNGTFLIPQVIAATTPFAFAVNDELVGDFEYELA